jgi:peptidyl-prolyl cis-trans isomerase A (cyclophilin A)
MSSSNISSMAPVKLCLILTASFLLCVQSASATTVRVITTLGAFSIQLFDDVTPVTVANFLNYVNSGRFNRTVIHRSEQGFVIQGGWLSYDGATNQLDQITTDVAAQNEFSVSNTRGTVAMAKVGDDPNSATSQWFVNLADNSAILDSQNGGFTAFGRVIGDGMTVVDNIAAQPTFTIAGIANFPLLNYPSTGDMIGQANFIEVAMFVDGPNFFDTESGLLYVALDAGTAGMAQMRFSITATEPSVVLQLDLSSVEYLSETIDGIATFDTETGRLVLPLLIVPGSASFRNATFLLTDSKKFLFTLESFEKI